MDCSFVMDEVTITVSDGEDASFPYIDEASKDIMVSKTPCKTKKSTREKSDQKKIKVSDLDPVQDTYDINTIGPCLSEETRMNTGFSETMPFTCGIEYICLTGRDDPEYDVYIGGAVSSHYTTCWVNWDNMSHDEYEKYVRNNKKLWRKIPKLENKKIACWCSCIDICHGYVLRKLCEERIRGKHDKKSPGEIKDSLQPHHKNEYPIQTAGNINNNEKENTSDNDSKDRDISNSDEENTTDDDNVDGKSITLLGSSTESSSGSGGSSSSSSSNSSSNSSSRSSRSSDSSSGSSVDEYSDKSCRSDKTGRSRPSGKISTSLKDNNRKRKYKARTSPERYKSTKCMVGSPRYGNDHNKSSSGYYRPKRDCRRRHPDHNFTHDRYSRTTNQYYSNQYSTNNEDYLRSYHNHPHAPNYSSVYPVDHNYARYTSSDYSNNIGTADTQTYYNHYPNHNVHGDSRSSDRHYHRSNYFDSSRKYYPNFRPNHYKRGTYSWKRQNKY